MTTNIAVVGGAGRMGGAIVRAAQDSDEIAVSAVFEQAGNKALGEDAGVLAGIGSCGVLLADSVLDAYFDVMIDFSTPESTLANLEACTQLGKPIVVGTTGMTAEQQTALHEASKQIPVFFASNMSIGVNVALKLLEMATKALGQQCDIEVIEAHHKHKVDAPSGTALTMGEVIADALGKDLQHDGVFAREGITGARKDGSIGFSTIRGGDIAGEHTVMFIGDSERVEISHRTTDRKIFAKGALRAASWLAQQPTGLYGMNELLGFD